MNYQTDFDSWKERIEALPLLETKLPNRPIDSVTADAETLAQEALQDKDALLAAGLSEIIITELPSLAGATRYCQANWMSEYRAQQEAQKEWLDKSPEAYNLRDTILHHFSFAFRNYPNLKTKVSRVREGNAHSDMIQDLIDLAILGEKNPEPLAEINYDVNLNALARTSSHSMSELLALSNGSKDEQNASKILRDKAYTLLAESMSTIREYGRYAFWQDEDRRKKYFAK